MILRVDGNINKYYAQTLCLVFFPGSTFGEDEQPGEGVPEVTISVFNDKDGAATAFVSMKLNDKVSEATETVFATEEVAIATHSLVAVGRAMFAAGKELLGHTPPWGILTGIRPAKIAGNLIAQGNGLVKTKKILRDEYFLNYQKAALSTSVANHENKIIKKLQKNTCSIYISIPFCPSRCTYCSFVSYTTKRLLSLIDEYIDVLIRDLNNNVDIIEELGLKITTVYIGGGTPTTLNENQLEKLLTAVSDRINTDELLEFTLEAGRPDTITKEKLRIAKNHGVTRVSVNPQTLNDDILREIGRKHTSDDFYRAFAIAKESGIRDINVDLIAGLPGDDFKNFSETVDKVIALQPTNITVHTFCVKKASDALKNNSHIYSLSGGDAAKSVNYSQLATKFAGYKPYYLYKQKNTVGNLENVGFTVDGHDGLYNIYMMEEIQSIFAVGAGAVTKLVDYKKNSEEGKTRIDRIFRPKYPYEYLKEEYEDSAKKECIRKEILDFFATGDKNG